MTDMDKYLDEHALIDYLKRRVSRTQFLVAAGTGAALAVAPGIAAAQTTSTPTATAAPESVQTILNTAVTAEHLAVTVLTAAVNNASQMGLSGILLAVTQAALTEEQLHADFLAANGAVPITDTFTVPDPKIVTDLNTFLHTLADTAEPLFIAAYMAAVREFTALNQPELAKYAFQIGTVEAEHRAIARVGLALTGDTSGDPPSNKAFETNLLNLVGDAATQLTSLGFINGSGAQAVYPGRAAAFTAAGPMAGTVIQTTPNNSTPGVPLSATLAPQANRRQRRPWSEPR